VDAWFRRFFAELWPFGEPRPETFYDPRQTVGDQAVAEVRFALGEALWAAPSDAGRDRERARILVQQARDTYQATGTRDAEQLTDIEAWLVAHPAE
jgi:hypothetical protein